MSLPPGTRPLPRIKVIPLVDLVIAHLLRALLLVFPMDVHQLGEFDEVARFERLLALAPELFDEVQVVDHVFIVRLRLGILLFERGRGRSRISREEQQQIVFQRVQRVLRDFERRCIHVTVRVETEAGEAAECGNMLVLPIGSWSRSSST